MVRLKRKVIGIGLIAGFLIGGAFWQWGLSREQRIQDYEYARDGKAVAAMFDHDWYWLIPFAKDEYALDLVLKYRAPQQNPLFAGRLIIKVVREKDKVVGFVAYYQKKPGEWFFNFLDVIPEYRGKGYASQLATYALEDMKAQGAHTITLVTYPHNEPALKLYKKLGFVEIARGVQVELALRV